MPFCKEIYKIIFSYVLPLDAVKLSFSSKYIYNIIRTIKYNIYIDINLNFDDNNENLCKILHSLKHWTNLKFRINVPELNTIEKLGISLPSYDNLYYYFEGNYQIEFNYINGHKVMINSMLPKNILRLYLRFTIIENVRIFKSLFKNVKCIDTLLLDYMCYFTYISFFQNIKTKQLVRVSFDYDRKAFRYLTYLASFYQG